jgi:hypothetical protein
MKLADMRFRQIGSMRGDDLLVGTNRANLIDKAKEREERGEESTPGEDSSRREPQGTNTCARSAGSTRSAPLAQATCGKASD